MPPRKKSAAVVPRKRAMRFKQAVNVMDSDPDDSRDAEPIPETIKTKDEDEDVSMNSTALPPNEFQNDVLITETVVDLAEAAVRAVETGGEDVSMSSIAPPPDESQNADTITKTVKTEDVDQQTNGSVKTENVDQQADGSQIAEPSIKTGKAEDVDVAMNSLAPQRAVLQTLPYDYVHYKHKGDIEAAVKEIISNHNRYNASYLLNPPNYNAAMKFLMSYLVAFEKSYDPFTKLLMIPKPTRGQVHECISDQITIAKSHAAEYEAFTAHESIKAFLARLTRNPDNSKSRDICSGIWLTPASCWGDSADQDLLPSVVILCARSQTWESIVEEAGLWLNEPWEHGRQGGVRLAIVTKSPSKDDLLNKDKSHEVRIAIWRVEVTEKSVGSVKIFDKVLRDRDGTKLTDKDDYASLKWRDFLHPKSQLGLHETAEMEFKSPIKLQLLPLLDHIIATETSEKNSVCPTEARPQTAPVTTLVVGARPRP